PQLLGHGPYGRDGRRRAHWPRGRTALFHEPACGQEAAGPGAEVLRRKVLARDQLQVLVYVSRTDRLRLPVLIKELKQLLAGQLAAAAHQPGQASVRDGYSAYLAALPTELEMNPGAVHLDVMALKRSQTEGSVAAGIFLVADTDKGCLEQLNHHGEQLRARQSRLIEVLL